MDGDRSDLAEVGKKRNTDHDFSPHYMWARNINLRTKNFYQNLRFFWIDDEKIPKMTI